MDLIDRYVYAVVSRLPESTRLDVEQELRANIQDMLPDGFGVEDVKATLLELGNPYRLAEEYRETKRYLIGPAVYDSYMSVLRLVVAIVVPIVAVLTMLGAIFTAPAVTDMLPSLVDALAKTVAAAFEAGVQAALWVTVVFAVLERTNLNAGQMPFNQQNWTPDSLPAVPPQASRKIPRIDAVLAMTGTIAGTGLLVLAPHLVGWYEQQNGHLVLVASLFDVAVVRLYLPAIVLLAATGLFVAGFKLISGRWSLPLAVANAVHNTLVSIFVVVAVGSGRIFDPVFVAKVQTALGVEAARFNAGWSRALWVMVGLTVIAAVFDSIVGFRNGIISSPRSQS